MDIIKDERSQRPILKQESKDVDSDYSQSACLWEVLLHYHENFDEGTEFK